MTEGAAPVGPAAEGPRDEDERIARAAEALFHGALERDDPDARRRWLDHAAGGDPRLRREVEELLEAFEQSTEFLETGPLVASSEDPADALIDAGVGSDLGPYHLEELLGEGGFGAVFRASQTRPVRREVALKIIKLGMDTRRVIARFDAERQALALMDHPSIARVLDAGATEAGRPYFVMDLVEGTDLTTFCDAERLTIRERCEVFLQLCSAVHHAHQRGLIHRDLKPSNVLAARRDGEIRVKVIDFGIAKATTAPDAEVASALYTEQGQVIGTPVYMSPEQALGRIDIDTRADVYSLGVLFYELLSGSTPLAAEELRDRMRAGELAAFIADYQPPFPSARLVGSPESEALAGRRATTVAGARSRLRGDLDYIALRALESDRDRRYDSAAAFERDVRNALEHRPIEATSPSVVQRAIKFVRRHRIAVTAGAAIVAATAVGAQAQLESLKVQKAMGDEHLGLLEDALDQSVFGDVDSEESVRRYERRIEGVFKDEASKFLVGGLATKAERLERTGAVEAAVFARRRAVAHALEGDADTRTLAATRGALGLQLVRVGRAEEGIRELAEAVRLDDGQGGGSPGVNAARLELARALLLTGDEARAEDLAATAETIARRAAPLDLRLRADALEALVEIRTRRGDDRGALSAWTELITLVGALSADPTAASARERIRLGRWLAGAGESDAAAYHLRLALQELRRSARRSPELEYEALVTVNELVTRAPSMDYPEAAAVRDLEEELRLARTLFPRDSSDFVRALRRVAEHYELRGLPVQDLRVRRELYDALAAASADAAERPDEVFTLLVRSKTLALIDGARSTDGPMDPETEEVLRWGLEFARRANPDDDELTAAQLDLEMRTGNLLRMFSLLGQLGSEASEDAPNPYILAWKAAAYSRSPSRESLDIAEESLERARAQLEGAGAFDERLRWTIEVAESLVREANERLGPKGGAR